jgi:hypothetical protein
MVYIKRVNGYYSCSVILLKRKYPRAIPRKAIILEIIFNKLKFSILNRDMIYQQQTK